MKKIISFDLQGTISNAKFSDEFWLEYIPLIYSQKRNIPLAAAKKNLENKFISEGPYGAKFYDHKLILDELLPSWDFRKIMSELSNVPEIDHELMKTINDLKKQATVIIISSTTRDFIDYELGKYVSYFDKIFSTISDLNIPGKPANVYQKIAKEYQVNYHHCLHIGDSLEMDIANSHQAGWHNFYYRFKEEAKGLINTIKNHLNS